MQALCTARCRLAATAFHTCRSTHAGIVHWSPPEAALSSAAEALRDAGTSFYGPCAGLPALVNALKQKLAAENGMPDVSRA